MSLKEYLEENKIDQIEDDQDFLESEYNAIQTYCENCGYIITKNDLDIIECRGLGESFINWKQIYVEDLWQEFGLVPIDPETERIEKAWKFFLPGTHREKIWHWFEESFNVSVAKDLME